MSRTRNMELSDGYIEHRKKRIVNMRDETRPSVSWIVIAGRLHIGKKKVISIYNMAKQEAKSAG